MAPKVTISDTIDAMSRTFHLEIFSEFLNLNNFRVKIFAPTTGKVAIANDNYLIISDGIVNDNESSADRSNAHEIKTLVEFSDQLGKPTVLLWLSDSKICVGFDSGTVACFDVNGNILFERKFAETAVQVMKISESDSSEDLTNGGHLWIMHAAGQLISVSHYSENTPTKATSARKISTFSHPQIAIASLLLGDENSCNSYKFVESVKDVNDFVVLPFVYRPNAFDVEGSSDATYSILVACDSDATLSMYNIGGKQQFQHLGKLGSYLKNQVSSAITKTFHNIFSFASASASPVKQSRNQIRSAPQMALASLIDFEDSKRTVLRLRMDPSGDLVAAADSLGRVTLYDARLNIIVRLWKGVRDARLAWSSCEKQSNLYLSLAIYAPQLGLLSFYAMKHGPCLRIVPIPSGSQCQIYTSVEIPHGSPSHGRISKCWLARGVEEGPTTADASLSSSNAANQLNQSDGAYSMRIVVMVIDPYAKMDDDLDPAPSSTLCAGSPQPHQKQAKEDKFFDAQLGSDARSTGGGDSIRELANGEDSSEDEDDDDCAFTDAISNDVGADADVDADGELHMFSPPTLSQAVAADIATAATRRSTPSSFPAPYTVREVEVVLRRFKSSLAEHSSVCLASVQQHYTISPTPNPNPAPSTSTGLLSLAALDIVEGNLLSLMTTLPSLSPLIECLAMVEYVELTGQTSGGDGSNSDVAALTARNLVTFSASFHKKTLQLLEQQIQIIKANLSSGREVVENVYSCTPFIEDLEREIAFRRSLLGGYSSFKDRDKDKECISSSSSGSSSSSSSSMIQDSQERLSALCKLNTSRAEAMCWLQSAPKKSVSPTHGDLTPKATNSSSTSFTLYRALHNTSGNDSNEMTASDTFRGANMLTRERDNACRPTISRTLSQILGTTSATVCDVTIMGPPTLKFAALLRSHGSGTVAVATAESVSLPSSVRSAVVQFLAAPLVGVDSDVFGLQGFTSALELSGLTCPSMLLLMLPCVVARIEASTLEDLTSMLLRDVSLSPFQRWFRDSLLNVFDDYAALSVEMKSRAADDDDGEDDREEEGEGEDGDVTESCRGAHERNGSASTFRSTLTASADQGSKSRQSTNSLKEIICNTLSYQAPPNIPPNSAGAGAGAGAGAAYSLRKGELSAASFDDCVRCLLRRAWSRIRRSVHMEASLAFVVLINETLATVSEQVTRRSYGLSDLKGTIGVWHNLFQQLRVSTVLDRHLIILKESRGAKCVQAYDSRAHSMSPTTGLNRLHSVFRVLALDTLSFAARAEDAIEHESHCRAVYTQRVQQIEHEQGQGQGQGHEQGGLKEGDGVPTAWGSSADSSWRDLLSFTLPSTSTSTVDVSPMKKGKLRPEVKKRTRRPLLLHFPLHNQPSVLCTFRAIELSSRWTRSPHRIDLLKSVGEHLLSLSAVMRAAVSEAICIDSLLPVLRHLLGMEEVQRSGQESNSSSLAMKELSVTLQDVGAADTFFKAAVELLFYAEQGSLEMQVHKSLPSDAHNHAHYPPERLTQGQGQGVRECGATCDNDSDDYEVEKAAIGHLAVWPPLADPYLSSLVSSFHKKHGSNVCSLRVCNAVLRVLQLITSLHLQFPLHLHTSLNKRNHASGSNDGFSTLFTASELKVLSSPLDFDEARPDAVTQNSICTAREDFLRTCFRRIAVLGEQHSGNGTALSRASLSFNDATSASMTASNDVSTSASSVCYMLSDLWSIKVQWVRSSHLEALLHADCEESEHRDTDRGQGQGQGGDLARCATDCSGARDIEVENLLPLISDTALAVKLLVGSLRRRMGTAVDRMQGIPEYGPLLAATDSDAVAWCLNWAADCAEGTNSSSEDASYPLRLDINLDSTRNLVARAHVLLEVMSLGRERDREKEKEEMKAYRGSCEFLLLLCDMLSKV